MKKVTFLGLCAAVLAFGEVDVAAGNVVGNVAGNSAQNFSPTAPNSNLTTRAAQNPAAQNSRARAFTLSPIHITAQRTALSQTSASEFDKSAVLHSGDLARTIANIPGWTMARKGGGGDEVFFRSQGGSRVPILLGGGAIHGGCGGRMDSGVSYIFPENYDTFSALKGPQDVRFGALISGGVLFEKEIRRERTAAVKGSLSALYGSRQKTETALQLAATHELGSLSLAAQRYTSDDYKSADGARVHSAYERESVSLGATFTPSEQSALEVGVDLSRGWAAYADRARDARTFDRQSWRARYQRYIGELYLLDVRGWFNEIDHIMDNFSHRDVAAGGSYGLSNPKRTNSGARAEFRADVGERLRLWAGGSFALDIHASRTGSGTSAAAADASAFAKPYTRNHRNAVASGFVQGEFFAGDEGVFFGARIDDSRTRRYATASTSHQSLVSAFARWEHYFDGATLYAGVGHAQRGADFWELNRNAHLSPERNTQLDVGATFEGERWSVAASAFASQVEDYIIIDHTASSAFNTRARLFGGEVEGKWHFARVGGAWLGAGGSASYTHGTDAARGGALPQVSPLVATLSAFAKGARFEAGVQWQLAAAQNRVRVGLGNVVGADLGAGAGYGVVNLYATYRHKNFALSAGLDNAFNKLYALHLSKNSADIYGYETPTGVRIYEPGRRFWVKVAAEF